MGLAGGLASNGGGSASGSAANGNGYWPGVVVADRTWFNSYDGVLGGFFRANGATVYTARVRCNDLRLYFELLNADSIAGLLTTEYTVALEYPIGMATPRHPVFFKKTRSLILEPGSAEFSDPIPVEIAAGDQFAVWVYFKPNGSGLIRGPGAVLTGYTNPDRVDLGATSANQVDSGTITNSTGGLPAPNMVLGQALDSSANKLARIPQPLCIGDSIMEYGQDDRTLQRNPGWVNRWFDGQNVAHINAARSGENSTYWATPSLSDRRKNLMGLATAVLYAEGVNDIATRTALQIATSMLVPATAASKRGLPFWACTVTPLVTTSTDGFLTVAGQTVLGGNPVRLTLNNWLRCGAPIDSTTLLPIAGTGTTNGTTSVTSVTGSFVNGQTFSGPTIAPGTTIVSGGGTATLTLSQAATGSSAAGAGFLAGNVLAGAATHPLTSYIEVANLIENGQDAGQWKAAAASGTATLVNTSTAISGLTTATGTWANGQFIKGTGIPALTTISNLNIGAGTATMSYAATAGGSGVSVWSPYTTDGTHPSQTGIAALVAGVSMPARLTS